MMQGKCGVSFIGSHFVEEERYIGDIIFKGENTLDAERIGQGVKQEQGCITHFPSAEFRGVQKVVGIKVYFG